MYNHIIIIIIIIDIIVIIIIIINQEKTLIILKWSLIESGFTSAFILFLEFLMPP